MKLDKITAEEINDSRGKPTLFVTAFLGNDQASFAVPSGASTGLREAHELRDTDGLGVNSAIHNVNIQINDALSGIDVLDQRSVDRAMLELDGTNNKSNIGGNAIIGTSIACLKLAAKLSSNETFEQLRQISDANQGEQIPHLFFNLINGGKHARNDLPFQEYQVVTMGVLPDEAVEMALQVQDKLSEIIKMELGEGSLVLGDEGGFAPIVTDVRAPLRFLTGAISELGFTGRVRLGLDVAASSFYKNGIYDLAGKELDAMGMIDLYRELLNEFDIYSIEDPFAEEDFESFHLLKESQPNILVIGDDLTVTNPKLLQQAINAGSINAMIIKPNQIGTVSEMVDTIELAIDNNIKLIISHRSGETTDDFIADVVMAFHAFGMKAGSPVKPERRVKYDRLIKIFQQ